MTLRRLFILPLIIFVCLYTLVTLLAAPGLAFYLWMNRVPGPVEEALDELTKYPRMQIVELWDKYK